MTDLMELPELNVELLSQIVTWAYADDNKMNEFMAKNFPDWGNWQQDTWATEVRNGVCKTSFCMAGQAVAQSGFVLNIEFEDEEDFDEVTGKWIKTGRKIGEAEYCHPVRKNGKDAKGNQKYKRNGDDQSIHRTAKEILGLTDFESDVFFNADNSIASIVWFATSFANARGVTLNLSDEILELRKIFVADYNNFNYTDYKTVQSVS